MADRPPRSLGAGMINRVGVPSADQMWYGGSVRTLQRARFSVAPATTDSTSGGALPAAQGAGIKIYVVGYELHGGSTAGTLVFNSKPGGAGAAISPVYTQANNGIKHIPPGPVICETVANEGLTITTGAGTGNSVGTVWFFTGT